MSNLPFIIWPFRYVILFCDYNKGQKKIWKKSVIGLEEISRKKIEVDFLLN